LYERIVYILTNAERQFVPKRSKNFYKFWWTEELNVLKKAAIESKQARGRQYKLIAVGVTVKR